MGKASKYKVINPKSPYFGKIIKAIPDAPYWYIDVRTGMQYEKTELREIPEKHAVYGGFHIGRFGLFLFGREYIKYHSYQFGVGIDYINSGDAYLDVELRVACFGVGVRFVWMKNLQDWNYYSEYKQPYELFQHRNDMIEEIINELFGE